MMRKTGITPYAVPGVALVALLAACGGGPPPAQQAEGTDQAARTGEARCEEGDPGVTADTIRIGVNLEITGPNAVSGEYAKNSADLAVKDINDNGGVHGKDLELVYNDNQSTNPGAVNALNKTLSQDDVFAVVGPVRSTQIQAIQEIVIDAKVPMAIGGTAPTLTDEGGGYLFRFRPPDSLTGRAVAEFAVEDLDAQKVAILHSSDAFGVAGAEVVEEAAAELGAEVVVDEYATGDRDFTAQLTSLRDVSPDVFVPYGTSSEDLAVIIRQVRELGIDVPIVGSPGLTSAATLELAGPALEGAYAVLDFMPGSNPRNEAFVEAFESAYGQTPDIFTAWQWDALHVMADAIERGGCDREAFRQALLETEAFPGVQGPLTAQSNGDFSNNLVVVQIKDGELSLVRELQAGDAGSSS